MKKLLLVTSALCLILNVNAQTPEKKSVALVTKITGVWCVYCGLDDYGWGLAKGLYDSVKVSKKGIFVAMYDDLGGPAATAANTEFVTNTPVQGVPTFFMGTTMLQQNTAAAVGSIVNNINSFAVTVPVASSAANYTITGNTINVTTKTKFWAAANGEYYLGSYVMEDGIMNSQTGQTGVVSHHNVFRAPMTANKFFGEQIAAGSINANQEFTKTFTIEIPTGSGSTGWDKTKLVLYTAIWKKNGSKYEFVNASLSKPTGGTAVNELANVENILMFPNPVNGNGVTVSFSAKKAMTLKVVVTDGIGRTIYTSNNISVTQGNNKFTIPTQSFSSGIYDVTLSSENGLMTQRLSVVK